MKIQIYLKRQIDSSGYILFPGAVCVLFSLFLPDDGWVKLTGVQVDETKGNGNGKLPRHRESDGQ